MIRRVDGLTFDGSCTSITIGLTEIPVLSFTYNDGVTPEWVWELGAQVPTAQTPGQYKPGDGKLKMLSATARALLFPYLPQFGAANALTQCVANYIHPEIGSDSDLLEDFRILGSSVSIEASAKALELELNVSYRKIGWTDQRIYFGNELGGGASGIFRL